jgi:hypothetical protein
MKLVSRNNVSLVLTFVLIILFSQSRALDFLIDTYLGRMFLLTIVFIVSLTNKILGLFIVLALIVFFNYNSVAMEGFKSQEEKPKTQGEGAKTQGEGEKTQGEGEKVVEKMVEKMVEQMKLDSVDLKEKEPVEEEAESEEEPDEEEAVLSKIKPKTGQAKAQEGFCMLERESAILRGKRPNSIPVFSNLRKQSDNVSPYDANFANDYTTV